MISFDFLSQLNREQPHRLLPDLALNLRDPWPGKYKTLFAQPKIAGLNEHRAAPKVIYFWKLTFDSRSAEIAVLTNMAEFPREAWTTDEWNA